MKLSVVIPVFNEAAVVEATHRRIQALLEELQCAARIADFEIIYVDDGSQDGTLGLLKAICAGSPRAKVISFSRNFGHQPALLAGMLDASGDAVVTIDADLQDPPELIETMLERFSLGNDIVYAVRNSRETDSAFKRWSARGFYRLMQLMDTRVIYDHADYRLVSRRAVEALKGMGEYHLFLRGIFPYLGFKNDIVHYDRQERFAGETKYPLSRMLRFAWDGITSFSNAPLRAAFVTGFAISLVSVALIAWALYVRLTGQAIPGWASIVIPVLFVGGLNILFVGLVAEYVGKVYIEVKRRPLFVIQERYNFEQDERPRPPERKRWRSGSATSSLRGSASKRKCRGTWAD